MFCHLFIGSVPQSMIPRIAGKVADSILLYFCILSSLTFPRTPSIFGRNMFSVSVIKPLHCIVGSSSSYGVISSPYRHHSPTAGFWISVITKNQGNMAVFLSKWNIYCIVIPALSSRTTRFGRWANCTATHLCSNGGIAT